MALRSGVLSEGEGSMLSASRRGGGIYGNLEFGSGTNGMRGASRLDHPTVSSSGGSSRDRFSSFRCKLTSDSGSPSSGSSASSWPPVSRSLAHSTCLLSAVASPEVVVIGSSRDNFDNFRCKMVSGSWAWSPSSWPSSAKIVVVGAGMAVRRRASISAVLGRKALFIEGIRT